MNVYRADLVLSQVHLHTGLLTGADQCPAVASADNGGALRQGGCPLWRLSDGHRQGPWEAGGSCRKRPHSQGGHVLPHHRQGSGHLC